MTSRSTLARLMHAATEGVFAVLFPSSCRLCGHPLLEISRLPVCAPCLAAVKPIDAATCDVCGELLVSEHAAAEPRCLMCRRVRQPFIRAIAFGAYSNELQALIHLFKYDQVLPARDRLAQWFSGPLGKCLAAAGHDAVVIPVPLYRARQDERGFNQSAEIARCALLMQGAKSRLRTDVLYRTRFTRSQTGLTRHQRRENVRGAFAVRKAELIAGRNVVLVDDVMTTGTTAAECARVLSRAGAKEVFVATLARVLRQLELRLEPASASTAAATTSLVGAAGA